MTDLWPESIGNFDRGNSDLIAPSVILKQQGLILAKKTDDLIEGEVINFTPVYYGGIPGNFRYGFFLVAKALQNYKYHLLTISHSIMLYPVEIFVEESISEELSEIFSFKCNRPEGKTLIVEEHKYMECLRLIFATRKVKYLISNLLNLSCK